MLRSERSVYTPIDFVEWREAGRLQLTPKFQRRRVWTAAARSYFIDTLLRGMPVPPIYLRLIQGKDELDEDARVIREVIDGQQRISAVLDFLDGDYPLSETLSGEWRGKHFDDLRPEQQQQIRTFGLPTEIFHGISDQEVLGIFQRLNTYSVRLNRQELRHGRYFGYFRQTAYALAHEHLEFWRLHRIFTETRIARMAEVELTSELLIAQLAGMQDKKKTIDEFYAKYDKDFPHLERHAARYRSTMQAVSDAMEADLSGTEFHRPPLFYTFFCVLQHARYGLPARGEAPVSRRLSRSHLAAVRDAVLDLSRVLEEHKAEGEAPKRYSRFVTACQRQTDNIGPRQVRFETLYRAAFG